MLYDAFDQVTAASVKFVSSKDPKGGGEAAKTGATRAIELPDEAVKTPLLVAFGKPERSSACECERIATATLAQCLYLIGSAELHGKLKDKSGRAAQLAADSRPVPEKIQEIYLWVYARPHGSSRGFKGRNSVSNVIGSPCPWIRPAHRPQASRA